MFSEGEASSPSSHYDLLGMPQVTPKYLQEEQQRRSMTEFYLKKESQYNEHQDNGEYIRGLVDADGLAEETYRDDVDESSQYKSQGQKMKVKPAQERPDIRAGTTREATRRPLQKRRSKESNEGSKAWKRLSPLLIRQRKAPSFANLPPTPMTAYFDAMSHAGGNEEKKSNYPASPVVTSVVPAFLSTDLADSFIRSPDRSSDGASADEMGTDGSAGNLSLSSEVDTPGPITPATPGWKPRELTLLRQKKASDLPSAEGINRAERERALVGLGLQTPSMPIMGEEAIRSRRTSRILAKDIFPIASGSNSKQASPITNAPPRELKLATSSGPPKSLRGLPLSRGNSSINSSPLLSSSTPPFGGMTARSPLPVLPPGQTFSLLPQTQSSSASENATSRRNSKSESIVSSNEELEMGAFPFVPDRASPLTATPNATPSPSFIDSLSTGSRRKGPPAPLILAYSPASSYSHHSPNGSAPASASSTLPTPQTSTFREQVSEGLLGIPGASNRSQLPMSPTSPGGVQAFHTPLQSPLAGSAFQKDQAQSLLVGLNKLLEGEKKKGVEEDDADDREELLKDEEDTEENTTADSIEDSQQDQLLTTTERQAKEVEDLEESTISSDAFEFESSSLAHSEVTNSSAPNVVEEVIEESESNTSSSDTPFEKMASSPMIAVQFNTAIFTSPTIARSKDIAEDDEEELAPEILPKSRNSPVQVSTAEATSSIVSKGSDQVEEQKVTNGLRQSQTALGPSTERRKRSSITNPPSQGSRQSYSDGSSSREREIKRSSGRRPSQSPMGPPPSLPLPTPPMPSSSFTSPVLSNREAFQTYRSSSTRSIEQVQRPAFTARAESDEPQTIAVRPKDESIVSSVSRSRLDRPLPPPPKSKASLVPDVPLFGYTGPISKMAEPIEDFNSPSYDVGQFDSSMMEDEPEVTSRWSSGSDSEDEKGSTKSLSKKASKQRKSISGNSSGQNSKKNSFQGGTLHANGSTTPKKSGFFAGLGLRKKSVPTITNWNTSSQVNFNSAFNTSSNSDSPALGKSDGNGEFPFPSSQRQSLTNSVRPSSTSPLPPPPLDMNDATIRGGNARNSRNVSASAMAARLSSNQGKKLTPRPSDGSIRTTASLQGGFSTTSRVSSALTSPAAQSPTFERKSSSGPWDEQLHGEVHGLGIQVPSSGGSGQEVESSDAMLRQTYEALRRSLRTAKSTESLKPSKTSRGSYRQSQEMRLPAMPSTSKDLEGEDQKRSSSIVAKVGSRQRSLTLQSIEKELGGGGASHGVNTFTPLSKQYVASPTQSNFSSIGSPDETPRIAYASLSNHTYSYTDHPKLDRKIDRMGTAEDEDGLLAMGEILLTGLGSKSASSATTKARTNPAKETFRSKGRRVRVAKAEQRPRYPSLTDEGRLWMEQRPNVAFGGAQGQELLLTALSNQQANGGSRGTMVESTSYSDESDSGTDDYGSSDGAGGQGSVGGKDQGEDGDRGDDDDDDNGFTRRNLGPLEPEDEVQVSSSDSEDSYGASDNDLPPAQVVSGARQTSVQDSSSSSSDDVPLGQRVKNPKELQSQLRRMEKKAKEKQRAGMAVAGKVEVPSNKLHYILDPMDLTTRLLKVQGDREAAVVQQAKTTNEGPIRSSSNLSRSKSVTSRKGPLLATQGRSNIPILPHRSGTMPFMEGGQSSDQSSTLVQTKSTNGVAPMMSVQKSSSSPLSPSMHQQQPPLPSSSTGYTNSSDATMVTAQEALPSSQGHQIGEDYRSAVVADFANTIKARSRSRSFAQPFSPSLDTTSRPPIPNRLALQPNKVPMIATGSRSPGADSSNNESITSPKERSGSRTMKSSSSAEEYENANRSRGNAFNPPSAMVQHRVFLVNKQRAGIAEVGLNARARDVVWSIMEREPMPADSRIGGWVLYDICADMGIERPIREYEVLSDVISVRTNAQNDYFVLKKTELAPYLSLKNVPNSSAALAGWVYLQDNHRKKWNKRWVELRENCLYQAKTEKGKEEGLICSLSSFDLYLTDPSKVKTPKQHSFALRSQTSINLFESPEADYVHYFSLSDGGAARHWITAIINARTFVLRLEKEQLFRMQSPTSATSVAAAPMAASLTSPGSIGAPSSSFAEGSEIVRRQQRALLDSSSPALPPAHATNAMSAGATSPLITFQQQSFAKGSLMEERFSRAGTENAPAPSSSKLTNSTNIINNNNNYLPTRESVNDRMRREEVQLAERKGRKEGKPLIGIIPEARFGGGISGHSNGRAV